MLLSVWHRAVCLLVVGAAAWGCSTEIVHDLPEAEANQILAALHGHGITGHKSRHAQGSKATYTVAVQRSDAVRAWQILREENLPRPRRKGLGEVFGDTGLVPTATQERALMHHAVAGELTRTLEAVDGVLEARVHVVLPVRDPLSPADAPRPGPKASVLLRVAGEPPIGAEDVKRLVAGAVKELRPKAVSVVVARGIPRPRAGAGAAAAMASVGPFNVAPGSRTPLLATLVATLALVLVLAAVVVLLVRRNRVLAGRAEPAGGGPSPDLSRSVASSMSLINRSLTRSRMSVPEDRRR